MATEQTLESDLNFVTRIARRVADFIKSLQRSAEVGLAHAALAANLDQLNNPCTKTRCGREHNRADKR